VFALICQAIGEDEAREKLGVNSTGLPFNSVIAIERRTDRTTNPMVNAGAIATASLAPGATATAVNSTATPVSAFIEDRIPSSFTLT
jgi:glutaminase